MPLSSPADRRKSATGSDFQPQPPARISGKFDRTSAERSQYARSSVKTFFRGSMVPTKRKYCDGKPSSRRTVAASAGPAVRYSGPTPIGTAVTRFAGTPRISITCRRTYRESVRTCRAAARPERNCRS